MYGSSTTELIKHLRSHEVFESTPIGTAMARANYTPTTDSDDDTSTEAAANQGESRRKHFTDKKKQRVNHKLMTFMVANNLPFQLVDSVEFQEFIDELTSQYQLPCRQTFRNTIIGNKV